MATAVPLANLSIETWLRFLAWLLVGFAIYFTYGASHRTRLLASASRDR